MRRSIPTLVQRTAQMSIEHKMPLAIATLLLSVIVVVAGAAYAEVRTAATRSATVRLSAVTTQVRELLQQSGVQLRAEAESLARLPSLTVPALGYRGAQREQVLATELRDRSGAVLLATARDAAALPLNPNEIPRGDSDSAVIGAFRRVGDTIVYPVVARAAIRRDAYVVRWRRLIGSRRSREQLTRLVGSDATLMLGNARGDEWVDFERPVPRPPIDDRSGGLVYSRGPAGQRYLATSATIAGTPWLLVVDFPLAGVIAPAQSFLWKMSAVAAAALALAVLVGWHMSRRITTPLRELSGGAEAIARGDFTRTVDVRRGDELGRLAAAFTRMAGEVQAHRLDLEQKVAERTSELNAAMNQLRDAQDSLVRKEKLALLGQLSSGVGHELRNPLGVMTNAIYYLQMVLRSAPDKVKEYLGIIRQQITLSNKIVSDLLDFARQRPPERAEASIAEITNAQLERLGPMDGVAIRTEFPATLPPVYVDQVQCGQIILNLLTNAIQSLAGRGHVEVRAESRRELVLLVVRDDGPGILPEHMHKIFEPLFTTKARGMGLGLAVSRMLARANSGDITVRSASGSGAEFTLTLPAAVAVGVAV